MNRSCVIGQIVDDIKETIGVGRTSATPLENRNNVILLPIGGMTNDGTKLKDKSATLKWAEVIQKNANKKYHSNLYGSILHIDNNTDPNGTLVTIEPTKQLIDAYEKQHNKGVTSNEELTDIYLKSKYFKNSNETTSKKILEDIAASKHPLNKLAAKLIKYADVNNTVIKLVPRIELRDNSKVTSAKGIYDSKTNTIEISSRGNFGKQGSEGTILHEIIHSFTYHHIKKDYKINKEFNELFEFAKTKLEPWNVETQQGEYALADLDEFIVALFTDAKFIKKLQYIQSSNDSKKYKNLFDEIFDYILNLLSINKTLSLSLYDDAFSTATNILNDYYESNQTNQYFQTETTVSKKNAQLEQDLKEFATINGIKIEFINSLVEQFGGDYTAAYDAVNRIVYVNEGKAGIDTLSEEIAHSLVEGLGDDSFLVKKALNLLSRTDYKSTLDPKYVALYKNNETALKHEVIGKMIAKVLVKQYEPKTESEFKLFGAIMQLIDKFISLFKRNDRLEDTIKDLASKITNKEVVAFDEVSKENSVYFQIGDNRYESKTNFPMQTKNFKNLENKTKSITIRATKYDSGVYKFNNSFYKVTLVNPGMSKASDIDNIEDLKKKFTDGEIKLQHIKDFFDDKKPAYIYQIEKLDDTMQKLYKENQSSSKSKSKVEDVKEQFVYLKQQLKKDIDKLASLDKDEPDFPILRDKIKKNKAALEELEATGNKQIIIDLGNQMLDNLEIMLNNVEDPDIELKLDNKTINAAEIAFEKLSKVPALAQRAMSLEQRLQPVVQEYMVKEINERATEGREITEEEIFGTTSDVSKLTGWFGKLSNSPNYIARTIHQMIKEVQTKVSSKNKENLHSIKEEVEALRQWSKDNGISEENMYDVFIQEHKGTTVLTRRFTPEFYKELDAAFRLPKSDRYEALTKLAKYEQALDMWIPKNKKYINDNFTKIQSTPALKRFYDFHTSLVKEAAKKLPVKINPEFIANISSNTIKDALKSDEKTKSKQLLEMASNLTGINIKQFKDGTYALDEGLFQDLIPLKFIASMDASKKSKNLGDNLAKFVNFANNYEEMSEILPTIRSMQNQLGKQSFTKSSDPTIAIKGVETNIYKFIDTVIDMQVKGNMKKDELKIKIGTLTDDEGNPIGEKYVHGSKVADFGMKYNSLLRIGLNPINAVTNLLVGDIGNIIEAFGGRFYTLTNLKDASNIFFKDALNEDSDLNHWRDKIGPLQELEDYETVEQVSTGKGINKEKVENLMYMPQKLGETWLQNRTMVAILLKDGYMDSSGKTTEKGKNITETELKRLINKCYEVNNKIHGRYSSRDAAAISQQVLPRMMMQFKKWIPAAIESRFESKHFNVDLGVEVEGRYKTGWRLLKRALEGDLKALQAGNMTELELYNMKKNLAEIVIALAATLSFIAMGAFGDDDEELKKNPYYKFTMDQLDRLSGDLLYFYNPGSYTETALKPIALAKTTSDVINCMVAFPHIFGLQGKKDVYSSGSRKGENKFVAKAIDVTPGLAPIAKVARNYKKDVKYQSYK